MYSHAGLASVIPRGYLYSLVACEPAAKRVDLVLVNDTRQYEPVQFQLHVSIITGEENALRAGVRNGIDHSSSKQL